AAEETATTVINNITPQPPPSGPGWQELVGWTGLGLLLGGGALGLNYLAGGGPGTSLEPEIVAAGNVLEQWIFGTQNQTTTGACFAAGTPLLTPEGSKPIEQYHEGDQVLSRAEDDPFGQVQAKVVLAVFAHDGYVLQLRVAGRVIRTTAEHPFWVVGKGWLPANKMAEGAQLLTPEGEHVAVEQVAQTIEHVRVYNLRVAGFKTYFVGCDEWG